MANHKNEGISLRIIVFVIFFLGIGVAFLYKFYETSLSKKLVETYNSNWANELKVLERDQKEASEAGEVVKKLYETIDNPKYTYEDTFKEFDNTIAILNVGINQGENRLEMLKKDKEKWLRLKSESSVLLGKRGNFIKNLLDKMTNYYDLAIKNTNSSLISGYVFREYFAAYKDYTILQSFIAVVSDDIVNKPVKYFYILSPLEKYSKDDYKIAKEEEIKTMYPRSYDGIIRTINYSRSYYSFTRDYVMGDIDSATYKISKLDEDKMNLNFDYSIVFNEGNDEKRVLDKNIITTLVDSIKLIKDTKNSSVQKGLFNTKENWSEDVVLCKLYDFKEGYYYSLTKKHPTSKTFDGFIQELSSISPSTEIVDGLFNKKTIKFTNNENEIKYECKNYVDNTTYTFITAK